MLIEPEWLNLLMGGGWKQRLRHSSWPSMIWQLHTWTPWYFVSFTGMQHEY